MSEHLAPIDPNNPGFDPGEPNTGGLTAFVVLFVLTLVLTVVATAMYFDFARERQEDIAVASKPSEELAAVRAREKEQTESYGYISREKGVVQIPLSRAMELLAKEAAEGKLKYSMTPTPVKAEGATAAAPAAAAAAK
jgi:hypothetical protein